MNNATYLSLTAAQALQQLLLEAYSTNQVALDILTKWVDYIVGDNTVIVSSNSFSSSGTISQYTGSMVFPYQKRNLSALLPYQLIFQLPYPTNWGAIKTYFQQTYNILLEDGEFEVIGNSLIGSLSDYDTVDAAPDGNNQTVEFTALPSSGRFTAGSTFSMVCTAAGVPISLSTILQLTTIPDLSLLTDH